MKSGRCWHAWGTNPSRQNRPEAGLVWVSFCSVRWTGRRNPALSGDGTFTSLRSSVMGWVQACIATFSCYPSPLFIFPISFLICKSSLCGGEAGGGNSSHLFTGSRNDYPGKRFWSVIATDWYLVRWMASGGGGSLWKNSQGAGHAGPVHREEARPRPGISKLQIYYLVKTAFVYKGSPLFKETKNPNSLHPPANVHTAKMNTKQAVQF